MSEKEKLALVGEIATNVQSLDEKEAQRVAGIIQGMKISKDLNKKEKGA